MGRDRETKIHFRANRPKKPHQVVFWEWCEARGKEVRRTRHFEKEIDAQLFAKDQGWQALDPALAVSAEERVALNQARGAAMVAGVSTLEIIEAGLESIRAQALSTKTPSLTDAKQAYYDACEREGARDSTLQNINRFVGFFATHAGEQTTVDRISPVMVQRAAKLRYRNPESARSYMAVVIAFFRWCAAPERQWTDAAWFRRIKTRSSKTDKGKVTIAAPGSVQAFMDNTPIGLQPGFAVQWLAGIRPEEVVPREKNKDRLQWSDIDLKGRTIDIRAEVSKTRRFRLIHDCFPALWSWLETTPKGERSGPLMGMNYRNFRKVRRAIADKADLPTPWPRDLMRDSFATYSYHIYGLETTINNTGHMDEQSTFFAHYKGSTIKQQAQKYLEIENRGRAGTGIWYAADGGRRKKKTNRSDA